MVGDAGERLVQVSWDMADKATFAREFDALVAARKEMGITDCTIVTWDDEGEKDGISIVSAWKWLMPEMKRRFTQVYPTCRKGIALAFRF